MKKLSTLLLTAVLLLSSANVFGTEINGVTYTNITGGVQVTAVSEVVMDVNILGMLPNGSVVTSIKPGLFDNNSQIRSITIDATNLCELPALCYNCTNLETVYVKEGKVTSLIVNGGFISDCPKLKYVIFPQAKLIYNGAIRNCPNLTNVTFSDVSVLGYQVIYNCPSVNYITWNSNVKELKCRNNSGNEVELNGTNSTSPFGNIRTQITQIDLGGKYVPDYLFGYSTSLTTLNMYSKLEEIGKYAFYACTSLKEVNSSYAYNMKVIGDYAFSNCPFNNCVALVDSDLQSIGAHAFDGYQGTYIYISGSETSSGLSIGDYAFANASALLQVNISGYIANISAAAFSSCPNIKTVRMTITNDWKQTYSYSNSPFANKSQLEKVSLDGSFTAPDYLFYGSGVKEATIECGGISQYTFDNCQSLTKVTWNIAYPKGNFTFCPFKLSPITTVILGVRVHNIPAYLFAEQTNLTSVTFPSNVETIGNRAFFNVPLTQITLPSFIRSIGIGAFFGCRITSLTIPERLESIGAGAFFRMNTNAAFSVNWNARSCDFDNSQKVLTTTCGVFSPADSGSPDSITFGNNVEKLPALLCYNANKLKSITLPASLKSIGDSAFHSCKKLSAITSLAVTPPTLKGGHVFTGCNRSDLEGITLVVPSNSTSLYQNAEGWCEFYGTCRNEEGIEDVPSDLVQSTKLLRNGQLIIRHGGKEYNALGERIL